jgi:RimJ/RimL family protein N-acetyltransferase
LAIGAAGTTTWERCCLGLPSVLIDIALNQRQIAASLGEDGYCIYLGSAGEVTARQISDTARALAVNPGLMRMLGRNCMQLVDGRGAERVALRMAADTVKLRAAARADSASLFAWRNAPENRRHALDTSPLDPDRHEAWLDAVLSDKNRILLIGECAGSPVGVLRYDVMGSEARVSIYLVPGRHGRGFGPQLLAAGSRWMLEHRKDVEVLAAEIRPENLASVRAFEIAGYAAELSVYRQRLRH